MTTLVQQVVHPVGSDPNVVPETYANGPVNFFIAGPCAQLTFTNVRPDIAELLKGGNPTNFSAVVVSRIVMPTESAVQLRDLLNQTLVTQPSSIGSSTRQ